MRLMVILAAMLASFAATAAEAETKPDGAKVPDISNLRIESRPAGWGYAHKTIRGDVIQGGHLSGGPDAVRVYQTEEKLKPDDIAKVRGFAEALWKLPVPEKPAQEPDQKTTGYTRVVVLYADGTQRTFTALWDQKFQPQVVQDVWDALAAYKVGAW
jgi:hypothetical protein